MDPAPVTAFYEAVNRGATDRLRTLLADPVLWRVRGSGISPHRAAPREDIVAWFTRLPPEVETARIAVERVTPLRAVVLALGEHVVQLAGGDRLAIPFTHAWTVEDGRLHALTESVSPDATEPLRRRGLVPGAVIQP